MCIRNSLLRDSQRNGTEFRRECFTKVIQVVFCPWMVWKKFPKVFSSLNSSERSVFLFWEMVRNGMPSISIFRGTEFRAFSVPRNRQNSDGVNKIRLLVFRGIIFFSENCNPSQDWMLYIQMQRKEDKAFVKKRNNSFFAIFFIGVTPHWIVHSLILHNAIHYSLSFFICWISLLSWSFFRIWAIVISYWAEGWDWGADRESNLRVLTPELRHNFCYP
jgi:hypothetical protein